jgi:hypothetical protein
MDIETTRNWKYFERARDKLKEYIEQLDGDVYTGEEIEVTFEFLRKGIEQLEKFYKDNLKGGLNSSQPGYP